MQNAISRKKRKTPPVEPKITGEVEAKIIALSCSSPPPGRSKWDNLNTHTIASLYVAFPADTARGLAKRLEIHCTPKRGSWLNIAEIELIVMTKQYLDRRISSIDSFALNLQNGKQLETEIKKVLTGNSQPILQESS